MFAALLVVGLLAAAACSEGDDTATPGAQSTEHPTTTADEVTTTVAAPSTVVPAAPSTVVPATTTDLSHVEPPADLVVTVGDTELVVPAFSYCWSNDRAGVCADGTPDLERWQVRTGTGHRPDLSWDEIGAQLAITASIPPDPHLAGEPVWTGDSERADGPIRVPIPAGQVAVRVDATAADGTASFAFLLDVTDSTLDEPRVCTDDPDGPTGLIGEPGGDAVEVHLSDVSGCAVRRDVAASYAGPEHCSWQRAQTFHLGRPIGSRTPLGEGDRYVRDPDAVFGDPELAAGYDAAAVLPSGSIDTGLRWLGGALWSDPADRGSIFVVWSDRTERWPLDTSVRGCD
jgi:hypothetical protein